MPSLCRREFHLDDRGAKDHSRLSRGTAIMARVLFVDHSGEPGGGELVLLSLAQHMGARCHVVIMADGKFPDLLAKANIPHSVLPMPRAVLGVRRESGVGRFLVAAPGAILSISRLIGAAARADI